MLVLLVGLENSRGAKRIHANGTSLTLAPGSLGPVKLFGN